MTDLVLGVEFECEIIDDPHEDTSYTTKYKWYRYPKTQLVDFKHNRHGLLVKAISEGLNDVVKVFYDGTIYDGFELVGDPSDLATNKKMWREVYKILGKHLHNEPPSGRSHSPGGTALSCGVHVHFSGKLSNKKSLGNLMVFLKDRNNRKIIETIAGRYDTHHCKIRDINANDVHALYHSDTCKKLHEKLVIGETYYKRVPTGRMVDNKVCNDPNCPSCSKRKAEPEYTYEYCCPNAENFKGVGTDAKWEKHTALNLMPGAGAGDGEIRIFKTPKTAAGLLAQLEFTHALFVFANTDEPMTQVAFLHWLAGGGEAGVYSVLWRTLKDEGFYDKPKKRAQRTLTQHALREANLERLRERNRLLNW